MVIFLAGCKEDQLSHDPELRLRFSIDSVNFDTVFTTMGSSTRRVMVYNDNKNALLIHNVNWSDQRFQLNLDGENNITHLHDIKIKGGDSLFLFVRVTVDPQDVNSPVLITDTILFQLEGATQRLPMQAYGQNVEIIHSPHLRTEYMGNKHFNANKPYLIYDTLIIGGKMTIDPGATLYMHNTANIVCYGDVDAQGTSISPIRIMGDRLDFLFNHVPYAYASGSWGGLYFYHLKGDPMPVYQLDYVDILSGTVGIYAMNEDKDNFPSLSLTNSRIHNHAAYGLICFNQDATLVNNEISNAAAYSIFMAGGDYSLVHNTIAAFYGYPYTNLNIHTVARANVAAVYIYNTEDEEIAPTTLDMHNCIITGANAQNLVVDSIDLGLTAHISHNYIKGDTLRLEGVDNNHYAQDGDSVFLNTYYLYKEYHYYDFHLREQSPAREIGDSTIAVSYPSDREGHMRTVTHPDAGCYQFVAQ